MDQQQVADRFFQDVEEFNRRAAQLGHADIENYYWYHTIELSHGLVTPGLYDLRAAVPNFGFPEDLRGKNVLDVGSATGFFAFEFARRGARVVSVELPSLYALDRFPDRTLRRLFEKLGEMIVPKSLGEVRGYVRSTAEQLYFYLLGRRQILRIIALTCPVALLFDGLRSPEGKLGRTFDLVFMGDILLHTLHPLNALAAVAPLCRGTLVLSQMLPDDPGEQPAMLYVGGDSPGSDEVSWWLPNKACIVQLLKKLGFRSVTEIGRNTGVLRPSGYAYDRAIMHGWGRHRLWPVVVSDGAHDELGTRFHLFNMRPRCSAMMLRLNNCTAPSNRRRPAASGDRAGIRE
jgi:SAM-dependent methyltransferase